MQGFCPPSDPSCCRALNIKANREFLTVAVRNLQENAIQHMPNGGRVTWRAAPNGTGVDVENKGPGIPDDELKMVTRRFFRGKHKSGSGTGLGLAIVELAVQRLGGSLLLQNRKDRIGLSATLVLPQP